MVLCLKDAAEAGIKDWSEIIEAPTEERIMPKNKRDKLTAAERQEAKRQAAQKSGALPGIPDIHTHVHSQADAIAKQRGGKRDDHVILPESD